MTSAELEATSSTKLLTLPNLISLVRLCCIPVFLWLLLSQHNRVAAAWVLGSLGATDWVDGFIARRFNQVSELGKILDPTADRLVLLAGAIGIFIDNSAPKWVLILALVRETLVSGAAIVLAAAGARRIEVQWVGKAGTFALFCAFPFFVFSSVDGGLQDLWRIVAWSCAIPGLLLSYYSASQYVPAAMTALREGRAARAQ